MSDQISGLAFIDVQETNPLKLFKKWQDEVADAGGLFLQINAMCLATSTKDGKVGNRTVVLKELDDDGFIFVTTKEGRKFQEIQENPWVASTFMWNYLKDGKNIAKQVRIEGKIIEISLEKTKEYYDQELFYCKIRAHLCHQDQEIEWSRLKEQHDMLLHDVINNKKNLPMPDYYIGYQIIPERMDFYYGWDTNVADRVIFTKAGNEWKFTHVAA